MADVPPSVVTIHLILDNYGIHTSRLVQKELAALDGKIALHFLPPYCPDSNRIEREWQELHANVTRTHRCKYLLTLLMYVYLYLAHRNHKATTGATGSLRYPVAA